MQIGEQMNIKKVVFIPIILTVLLVLGIFFGSTNAVSNIEFTALNGAKMSLEKLHGKPVIVTFWATDCDSCLKEIPLWLDFYERYHPQGLEILGVAMYYDPPNHVIEFNKMRPLPYPITLDVEAKFANAFGGVKNTPTTFLLNANSEIVWQKVGLIEREELAPLIENLLKEK